MDWCLLDADFLMPYYFARLDADPFPLRILCVSIKCGFAQGRFACAMPQMQSSDHDPCA